MSTLHPDVVDLADFVDGVAAEVTATRIRRHLPTCPLCSALVANAHAVDVSSEVPDLSHLQRRLPATPPERWLSALREHRASAPQPGQLWRVRTPDPYGEGPELTAVVALVTVGEDLLAAPVTSDPQEATDLWTAHLPVDGTGVTAAVWVSLAQPIGAEALDVHLGDVDAEVLLSVHRALRRGQRPPADVAAGGPLDEALRSYRESLRARLTLLGEARLTGHEVAEDEASAADTVAAMKQLGWSVARLVEITGLPAREARDVLERTRGLTDEQTVAVDAALGLTTRVTVIHLPTAWVQAIGSPLRRRRFENEAARRDVEPWTLRTEQVALLPAARKNAGTDVDWDTLAEQRLIQLEQEAIG